MKFIRHTVIAITPLFLHLISPLAWADPAPARVDATAQAISADAGAAKKAVAQAEALYQQGKLEASLEKFEKAYDLMAGHPAQYKVWNNIALCQVKMLRIEQGIKSYQAYLDGLEAGDAERAEIEKKIEDLKKNAGYLRVEVTPTPGTPTPAIVISIDGHAMPQQEEYMIPQGVHRVEMNPDGIEPQTKPVGISAAEHQTLTFELIDPYKEAKERVGRAEELYEAGNYDAALTEFTRAYETMVGHPARAYVLYNIARCQERLYRYDAAVASYKEYLSIASDDEADRPKVEATIESLEGFLGTIIVAVNASKGATLPSYEVWVDGHLVGSDLEHFFIPGGTHQVEIRAEGFEGSTKEVQVPSRAEKKVDFTLSPLAKEYKGISKTYFYTATGLTVAAAATGTAFGILTLTKRRSIDQKEQEAVTQDDADQVKRSALYADIFFISAGVFATSATILAFLTDWSSEQPPDSAEITSRGLKLKEVGLLPHQHGGMLSVGGTFSW